MSDRVTVRQKSAVETNSTVNVTSEVSRVGVLTVAAFGALVGLWSLACLIGGLAASGGPLAFAGNWFKAVTGM